MDNLHEMNEQIGIVKWFGDSTKEGFQGNYGYIERIEKPDSSDIKVHWKGLSCSLDEIKWKKGLLVRFKIGKYRGKEEAINVEPIRVPGYVDWHGDFNQKNNQVKEFGYVVIDTTVLIGKRVAYIIAKSKNNKLEQNDISLEANIEFLKSRKNFDYRIRFNKEQLLCSEFSLSANTDVCFCLEKNHRTNNYEALKLSLLEDEENHEILEIATHSRNPTISKTAFRKYLTILPNKEAIIFIIQRCNNSSLRSKILISTIPEKLLSLNEAKPVRDLLPLGQHLKLCLEMITDNEQVTNEEILSELFSVAKNVAEEEKNSNHLYWKSIPENLLESKIKYKGFLWSIIPDYIKYKIAARYLQTKPDIEAVEIANNIIINLACEKDKIDFINLISDHLKSRFNARLLREMLPAESRLKIYYMMVANYKANELITHNVEEEIINTLTSLPTAKRELWLGSNIEGKVIYKGFLWKIAPERVKRRIIEEKFGSFLSTIKNFNSGYKYEDTVTASAKDCYSNLDQKDWQLARQWISSENQNNQHIQAQMLSARAAEKFAIKFYQSLGYTVEDVSLQQISSNSRDWCNYDLLLNDSISIDIKNSRTDVNNKKGYSKFCVPKFKQNRSNNEVIIAGVLSPYLKLEDIEFPAKADSPPLIFMGEIKNSELDSIKKYFSRYFHSIKIPKTSGENYLPPWCFDYKAKVFYTYQKEAIWQFKKLTSSDLPDWDELQLLKINPIPLCIAAKISLPSQWKSYLSNWQQSFISECQKIPSERISLPYLFLSLLSHFLDMLRFNEGSFHPEKYNKLLYSEEYKSYPLGIYDPLNIIKEFCKTLSLLWDNRYESRITEFKIFDFDGRGLLRGKKDSSERLVTIIAYCGGSVEKKGKCGFTPLILGKHKPCPNCGKLICPKCNYCSDNCKQRLERQHY
jgi:cold shock CspA family protein